MIRVALALIVSLLLAGSAHAQVCRSGVCVVRQQVVAPVKVAAVANAYVAPVQAVAVQQYAYPYYYQVGQGLRDEAIAQKVADRIFEQVVAKLEAHKANGAPTHPADSSLGQVQAIVNRSCVGCHSAESDPDRMDLTDVSALTAPQFESVVKQVYSGKMPKNAEPLTDEEVAFFVDAHLTRPAQ